jgi:DDE_Tnp_1-associated
LRAQSATVDTSTTATPPVHDSIGSAADPGPAEASCRDLLEALRAVVDPRDRRGIRHQLVSILTLAAAAVVAGARSYVAVGRGAAHAPAGVLAALEVRVHPPPGTSCRRAGRLSDVSCKPATATRSTWCSAPGSIPGYPPGK